MIKKSMVWILLAVAMATMLYQPAGAQFPPGLLPPSRVELGDSIAVVQARLDSLLTLKADTSVTNALSAELDSLMAVVDTTYGKANNTNNTVRSLLCGISIQDLSVAASGGLNLTVEADTGGAFVVVLDGNKVVISDSIVPLTASNVNYVYADTSGQVKANITGFLEGTAALEHVNISIATVETSADTILWVNGHYEIRKRRLADLSDFLELTSHYAVQSGFEVGEGTTNTDGFDFGAAGTDNIFHALHGWSQALGDTADLYFTDDVIGTLVQVFDAGTYGDEVALSGPGYYSKFILFAIARNDAEIPIFHITRSLSEYSDVGQATAAPFPSIPSEYHESAIPLIGVTYKRNADWSDLSTTKDWIVTDYMSNGVVAIGGGGGLDVETVGAITSDSLVRVDARIDSSRYHFGIAADTTRPGFTYYQDTTDGKWHIADSSIAVTARGICVDSVFNDSICRFQKDGLLTIPWYNFPSPGIRLVNGFTAGSIVVTDATRDSTLKMHNLGYSTTDSTKIEVSIDKAFWIWRTP